MHGGSKTSHIGLLAILAVGCTTGSEPPAPYEADPCGRAVQLSNEIDDDLQARFAGPCETDNDCAVDGGLIRCPESTPLDTGEIAYSILVADDYEAAKLQAYSEVCALKCETGFHMDNFFNYAYCRDGTCHGTYPPPDRRCGAIAQTATVLLESAFSQPADRACQGADECTLFATDLPCSEFGHEIVGCPVALPSARAEEVEEALATLGQRSCNDFGYTCNFHSECDPVEADCIDGQCVAKVVP